MIPVADLEELKPPLREDLLYLFVCGPGGGAPTLGSEALALALPGSGWMFVDCCRVGDDLPQEKLWLKYRRQAADVVLVSVLTHPHDDHAAGWPGCWMRPDPRSWR
jgi:glyoxylase-like metal-dependent hydrolase (beta-lactamase superfamily II)